MNLTGKYVSFDYKINNLTRTQLKVKKYRWWWTWNI